MRENDSNTAASANPNHGVRRSRGGRVRWIAAVVVVVAAIFTATGIYLTGSDSPPQAVQTTPPRPSAEVQVYDLYGMTLAQAEEHLGVTGGKNAAGVHLNLVAIPAGPVIDGVPNEELTVTAACVAPADTPTGTNLERLNLAVTPSAALTDELRRRILDRSFTGDLTSATGCAWWGGAFTVYTD